MARQGFEPLTLENMQVFSVDTGDDLVAAACQDDAARWYAKAKRRKAAGMDVSAMDLNRVVYSEDHRGGRVTLRKVLTESIKRGATEPFVIASTEY